jgi:hypothetical protein
MLKVRKRKRLLGSISGSPVNSKILEEVFYVAKGNLFIWTNFASFEYKDKLAN